MHGLDEDYTEEEYQELLKRTTVMMEEVVYSRQPEENPVIREGQYKAIVNNPLYRKILALPEVRAVLEKLR